MLELLSRFYRDDSGAVTVDWVVLTAAIIGLGLAVLIPIGLGATSLSDGTGAAIGSTAISTAASFTGTSS